MKATESVCQGIPRGQKQDGSLDPPGAERLAEVTTVPVRETDVDHYRIGRLLQGKLQKPTRSRDRNRIEALGPEATDEDLTQRRVVFDDQQTGWHNQKYRLADTRGDAPFRR
jgi:hypothetical protein